MIATLLLLLLSHGDINARTRQNLAAMQNISALQVGEKESYRVGVFKGVSRPAPTPHKGVYFGTEWYSLLQDSQKWTLVPQENYFIYTSQCWWSEVKRGSGEWAGWVPCEGEVYVDSEDNIMRIVQRLAPKRMVTNATMIIDYGWVELKARRLVPLAITLSAVWHDHRNETISAHWVDYHEWGVESLVKDVDDSGQREGRRVELLEGTITPVAEVPRNETTDTRLPATIRPSAADVIVLPKDVTISTTPIKPKSRWRRLLKVLRPL